MKNVLKNVVAYPIFALMCMIAWVLRTVGDGFSSIGSKLNIAARRLEGNW